MYSVLSHLKQTLWLFVSNIIAHIIIWSISSPRSYANGIDNPFAKRESHGRYSLTTYRVLVPLTWLLVVVVGVYYTMHSPDDVKHGHKIFKQGNKHITPFSLNTTITEIYWYAYLERANFSYSTY